MATMDSLNRDTYAGNSETDKMSLNVSVLPLTSPSASSINVQAVEVSTQSLADKTLYTALPEMTTSDNSNNYVLINLQELQDKVWNEMGTPFLVLTNNEKGNVEAKVLYNTSSVGLIKLPASAANIHTLAQSTNKTVKQTPKTLICVSSEQAACVSKTETPTQTGLESKQLLSTFASSVTTPTAAVNAVSVALGTEQGPTGCTKTFTTIGYKKYNPQTSQGVQRSLECSFEGCGRKFSWPAHLKYHQMTHTGERQYACTSDGCLKTFYTSQRLAVHIRTHTGEKPFKCQEEGCEKAFTTAGNLKNHIRVHTGERPFVCNYVGCSRSFAEYSSLRKHKLVHTGEKPFICDECGKSFSQSGSRTVHIKRHHGIGAKKGKGAGVTSQPHPPIQNDADLDKKGANIFILRNAGGVEEDEGIMQYQDFPGGESVVFSQDMSDHVVTVTTQPCAAEVEERVISDQIATVTSQPSAAEETQDRDNVAVSQEMLSSEMLPPDDNLGRVSLSSTSANVMVLSQPQEMVSLGGGGSSSSTYHASHASSQGTDDIVYENDLLQNDLDQKEMSATMGHHIVTISASLSPQQELAEGTASLLHSSKEVTLDPMMASDEEDEDGLSIGIQQHAKVN